MRLVKLTVGYILWSPLIAIALIGISALWCWYFVAPKRFVRESLDLALQHVDTWFPKDPPNERTTQIDR